MFAGRKIDKHVQPHCEELDRNEGENWVILANSI
jgi:hypothetical protein